MKMASFKTVIFSKGVIKNIIIVVLVVLTLFQTYSLWFANAAGQALISGITGNFTSAASGDEQSLFVSPERIIEDDGGNVFHIQYNDLSQIRAYCDAFIKAALRDGEYVGTRPADYGWLLDSQAIIYEYAFDMPSGLFAEAFGQKNAGVVSKCAKIRGVYLYPGDAQSGNSARIVFFDGAAAYEYRSKTAFAIESHVVSDLTYESSALDNSGIFDGNVYIPRYPNGTYTYPSVQVTNPYVSGDKLLYEIGKSVSYFFSNPAAVVPYLDKDGVWTYGDDTTVVKYYQNDVLTYSSYKPAQGGVSQSVLSYFSVAVNFIKNDSLVTNEKYLAGYEQNGAQMTFYFDYAINNLPVIIPDSYKGTDDSSISSAIAVTVADGRVRSYKKLVYGFSLSYKNSVTASVGFDGFLGGIMGTETGGSPAAIGAADIRLGFILDKNSQAVLYWVLNMGGNTYSVSAQDTKY